MCIHSAHARTRNNGGLAQSLRPPRLPRHSARFSGDLFLSIPEAQGPYVLPAFYRAYSLWSFGYWQAHKDDQHELELTYSPATDKAASLEPWFPAHLQRDIYNSLLHLEPAAAQKEKKAPSVPESVLKAALLRRATEDIRRVLALRSQKQALAMLLQRGSVGDDLWQRFMRAEKEMEEEVKDVVAEVRPVDPLWI